MALKAIMALTLFVAGCVTVSANPGPTVLDRRVELQIDNMNWSTAVIYAVVGSSNMRLGQVRSMSKGILRVPEGFTVSGQLRLYVRFVTSGDTFTTYGIPVQAGERVEFIIRQYLPFSTLTPLGAPRGLRHIQITKLPPLRHAIHITGTNGGRNDV